MRYLSLFSGIEAATQAWHPLGWECVGVSEICPFGRAALAQHYPNVPNLGDVTLITEDQIKALGRVDLLVFGSPCQDLSVAGKRKGFTDDSGNVTRSGLFHAAVRIIGWARKHCGLRYALWENVPGAFSSNKGRDFAVVVGELAGCDDIAVPKNGWGNEGCAVGRHGLVEWSTLDAQWFGVAQRRRRVFAFADFGDWSGRQPILLEPYRLRGDTAPRREAGQNVAGTVADGFGSGGQHTSTCRGIGDYASSSSSSSNALRASGADLGPGCEVLVAGLQRSSLTCVSNAEGAAPPVSLTCSNLAKTVNNQTPLLSFALAVCPTLRAGGNKTGGDRPPGTDVDTCDSLIVLPFDTTQITSPANGNNPAYGDPCHPLARGAHAPAVCVTGGVTHTLKADGFDASEDGTGRGQPITNFGMQVRRLTPTECERLQGMRDGYTNVIYNRKPAKDGPRYKALGNSMAVPVMNWIGRQIDMIGLFQ